MDKMAWQFDKLTLFLIPIAVGINFIGYQLFFVILKTPFTCDAIGTILIGALCGPLAGATAGLVTNAINAITNPTSLFYAILNVLFGIAAGLIARRGGFTSIWRGVLASLVFSFIGGVGSILIGWPLFGFDFYGSTPQILIAIPLYEATHLAKFLCAMIASLLMDIPDKIIACVAVVAIIMALPIRYLVKLPNGNIFINKEYIAD
ncbi:hypothetical protein A9798_10480 [Edwardsiella hoshinae]|uniref:ECF transporter S component n=1 Tax=Edwardsiella hoshinae TaxID=93378 RepID=A0ABM6EJW5_9GAMM|nr:ECF transporter S component [Edwardsiella hoshinae]AOV97342.1 hypothetical protein A9798_10480 [Edwardsiella hoshinae]